MATQPERRLKRQTIVGDLAELEVVYRLDAHRRSTRWRALAPGIARDANEAERGNDLGRHADLLAAVSALPDKQRAAVVLYYLADWSVDDVAAALLVAPGTVKSSLSMPGNGCAPPCSRSPDD